MEQTHNYDNLDARVWKGFGLLHSSTLGISRWILRPLLRNSILILVAILLLDPRFLNIDVMRKSTLSLKN